MFKILKYQLYLLQLENYEISRYFYLLKNKGFLPPKQLRGELKWTGKAKLLMSISILIHYGFSIIVALIVGYVFDLWIGLVIFLFVLIAINYLYFILFPISLTLINPLHIYKKNKIISKAKVKLSKLNNLKVIGIAGSYGKTSMKEVLKTVLSENFQESAPSESINTPIGIAKFILDEVNEKTEILIIEMGEHYSGDVLELCKIVNPDIGIITGINESHLERLDNIESTIKTVFEMADGIKDSGFLILNADDKNILDNYKKYTAKKRVEFYSKVSNVSKFEISDYIFSKNDLTNKFSVKKDGELIGNFQTKVLGEYVIGIAVACIIVGKEFKMENNRIVYGLFKIKPVAHRLEPIINPNGLLVIDDSYNGNPEGVSEAIKLLSKFDDKRKVFLTPGLVETGKSAEIIHKKIGQELSKVADLVLLIKNSVTPFIAQGLKENGFADDKIIWYSSAQEAHKSLNTILVPNDVILFQNDWGDQYL